MRRVTFALSPLRHLLLITMIGWATVVQAKINVHELRCEVCQRTVEEMVKDVDSVDPDKRVHVGEFMLDHNGDRPQKTVELRRSEIYLTELMEKVCSKMDDYVRAIMKDTGKLIVIPLIINGMMNPIIGDAEIIQDGDLNRSLKFYCENIVEEFDEGFVKYFGERVPDASQKVCWEYSNLCQETYKEEYEEDIVAAEKRNARKKKSTKKKKKKKAVKKEVDPEELTGEERIMDQISRLPITGPNFERRYDDEDEDDVDVDDAVKQVNVASDGKPEIINEAVPDTLLNEPIVDPVMKDPVLADSVAKDEL